MLQAVNDICTDTPYLLFCSGSEMQVSRRTNSPGILYIFTPKEVEQEVKLPTFSIFLFDISNVGT